MSATVIFASGSLWWADMLPLFVAVLVLADVCMLLVIRRLQRRLDAVADVAAAALGDLDHA